MRTCKVGGMWSKGSSDKNETLRRETQRALNVENARLVRALMNAKPTPALHSGRIEGNGNGEQDSFGHSAGLSHAKASDDASGVSEGKPFYRRIFGTNADRLSHGDIPKGRAGVDQAERDDQPPAAARGRCVRARSAWAKPSRSCTCSSAAGRPGCSRAAAGCSRGPAARTCPNRGRDSLPSEGGPRRPAPG